MRVVWLIPYNLLCNYNINHTIILSESARKIRAPILILAMNFMVLNLAVWVPGFNNFFIHAQQSSPVLNDPRLQVELITEGIVDPTTMAFLAPNDILVLEKGKGTVQRIVNGQMLPEPVLDVNVSGKDERGLLGIAVARNTSLNAPYIFLYYTEAKDEDGGDPVGNRLYRYELVDNKLVNPKLLLDLPYLPGPAHNGGVVEIGPDNNVYVAIGELLETIYNKDDYNTLAQNYANGKQPDGRAGILRVTQDGKVVNGKGILGDEHPLDMYYAYGIRNSFGIDLDPVTGNLWDTENGPKFGDEINLVEPGFNSGWAKIAGVWIVNMETDEEGNRVISKGEKLSSNPNDLFDFKGRGKYSPPELSWENNIAPTGIAFLNSDKLGKQYENDLFVGSFLEGNIYHFDLTANRSTLDLNNLLEDRVASSPEEVETVIFGKGFGTITDLEVGPDGYLYVLAGIRDEDGKIYRISTLE
jgi:aldose sugar dehydrogenase